MLATETSRTGRFDVPPDVVHRVVAASLFSNEGCEKKMAAIGKKFAGVQMSSAQQDVMMRSF